MGQLSGHKCGRDPSPAGCDDGDLPSAQRGQAWTSAKAAAGGRRRMGVAVVKPVIESSEIEAEEGDLVKTSQKQQ